MCVREPKHVTCSRGSWGTEIVRRSLLSIGRSLLPIGRSLLSILLEGFVGDDLGGQGRVDFIGFNRTRRFRRLQRCTYVNVRICVGIHIHIDTYIDEHVRFHTRIQSRPTHTQPPLFLSSTFPPPPSPFILERTRRGRSLGAYVYVHIYIYAYICICKCIYKGM